MRYHPMVIYQPELDKHYAYSKIGIRGLLSQQWEELQIAVDHWSDNS